VWLGWEAAGCHFRVRFERFQRFGAPFPSHPQSANFSETSVKLIASVI
jgi:hypothetical protein